jgi:NAD(P)-dependent dehydrogenase (short-subunit alcohol dehydrogenase family)
MKKEFTGKVIAITGAARGIGETLAKNFIMRGAKVVALDRNWDVDSVLHHQLIEAGALPVSCDITDDAQVDRAFDQALEAFGTVDVLINNAAMRQRDLYPVAGACAVLETHDAHWTRMFEVNVVGTLKITRRFIQPMLAKKSGSIINVSANGSLTHAVSPGISEGNHPHLLNQPYDATKAALTSMSFYLADEVKPANVAVNVVFPGATRTTGSDDLTAGREKLHLDMPLLDTSHVIPACIFLAKERALTTTGRAFDLVTWNQARQPITVEA